MYLRVFDFKCLDHKVPWARSCVNMHLMRIDLLLKERGMEINSGFDEEKGQPILRLGF